jgi:hypothetical protein
VLGVAAFALAPATAVNTSETDPALPGTQAAVRLLPQTPATTRPQPPFSSSFISAIAEVCRPWAAMLI